jgi:hypothetical protein
MLKIKITCCAVLAACLAVAAAPYQTFKMDRKNYVPFDNTTTVTVECPDSAAVVEQLGRTGEKLKKTKKGQP